MSGAQWEKEEVLMIKVRSRYIVSKVITWSKTSGILSFKREEGKRGEKNMEASL